jgi:hypothetical protein
MFDEILLEQEQEELLIALVEASRNVPKSQRTKFILIQTMQDSWIKHPGVRGTLPAYKGDIEVLANEGLLNLAYSAKGTPNFDVTPRGFRYYEYLKHSESEPIQRIEAHTRNYLIADQFQQNYSNAYQKWSEAEQILWSSDSEQQLTTIGHLCREAIQDFITVLVNKYSPPEVDKDKAHTIVRAKAVLICVGGKLGKADKPFLDALIDYWGAVSDLIQRQEQGGQKEGRKLVWEDGRRVVFQTAMVMFEFDKSLSNLLV